MSSIDVTGLLNLDDYPIDQPGSEAYRILVANARNSLVHSGAVVFGDFLHPDGLKLLAKLANELVPSAFHCAKTANPYNMPTTDDLPENHPYRFRGQTDRYGIAYHQMRSTVFEALYTWEPLRRFVADVLTKPVLYLHDDPSNAVVINVYKKGGGLAWHFDRARSSTVFNLQATEQGGVFEYVPNIRTFDDERFDAVASVLQGERNRVLELQPSPGSLTVFLGRDAVHRVAEIQGKTAQMSLIFSYEEEPGVRMDEDTRKRLFGPTAPSDPA